MKLSNYKKDYQEYSGKASEACKQLSFAGIAVIWIFKYQSNGSIQIPNELIPPLVFFCLSLALGLGQYILGYIIWHSYFKYLEWRGMGENEDIKHSAWLPALLHLLMISKIVAVALGYVALIRYLYSTWLPL